MISPTYPKYPKYPERLGAVAVQELSGRIPSPPSEWVSRCCTGIKQGPKDGYLAVPAIGGTQN